LTGRRIATIVPSLFRSSTKGVQDAKHGSPPRYRRDVDWRSKPGVPAVERAKGRPRGRQDLIGKAAGDANNHGQFDGAVAHLTNSLRDAGAITNEQKGILQSTAAKSKLP
jgi:hypothetical protein